MQLGTFSVILMHGPPFVGKKAFYMDKLSVSHRAIEPSEIYHGNPELGLRDIGLQVYKYLKQDLKVVILDTNECKSTRQSYINLLHKKCGNDVTMATVSLVPVYGSQQLWWSREMYLAQLSLVQGTDHDPGPPDSNTHREYVHIRDQDILKWFEKETDVEIYYRHGIVEAPSSKEGCHIHKEDVGITVMSNYKFEVPCLFIEWELIINNERQTDTMVKICHQWSGVHPCGRIIVICDGRQIRTGELTRKQQLNLIRKTLTEITTSFTDVPIYVLHMEEPKLGGGYIIPPKPGLLAYLQRRHCLDLHSKSTVYLYETSCHMKMAENAGMRHLKGARVLDRPSMVTSGHAATTPSIPEMLKHIKFIPQNVGGTSHGKGEESSTASIPVYGNGVFKNGAMEMTLGYGRSEYLFAKTWDIVEKYQKLYSSLASRIDESGSKLSCSKLDQSISSDQLETSLQEVSGNQSRLSIGSRDLPKWMLGKEGSNSSRSSVDSSKSITTQSSDVKIKKTVYVMTEKELVDMATDILKQAGKTDILDKFEANQKHLDQMSSNTATQHARKTKKQTSKTTSKPECYDNSYPKMEPIDSDNNDQSDITVKPRKIAKKCNINKKQSNRNKKGGAYLVGGTYYANEDTEGGDYYANEEDTDSDRSTEQSQDNLSADSLQLESDSDPCDVIKEHDDVISDFMKKSENSKFDNHSNKTKRKQAGTNNSDIKDCEKGSGGFEYSDFRVTPKVTDSNVVSNILDEFVSKNIERKASPRKHTVNKVRDNSCDSKKKKQSPDLSILDELFS